jgi:hypothetical protein
LLACVFLSLPIIDVVVTLSVGDKVRDCCSIRKAKKKSSKPTILHYITKRIGLNNCQEYWTKRNVLFTKPNKRIVKVSIFGLHAKNLIGMKIE